MTNAVEAIIKKDDENVSNQLVKIAAAHPPSNCGNTAMHEGLRVASRVWSDMITQLRSSDAFITAMLRFNSVATQHLARLESCPVCHAHFEGRLAVVHAIVEERSLMKSFGKDGL